jgi:hypothetical protein
MNLPAIAVAAAFVLGIAFGLSPEITHGGNSHGFVAFLLFGAVTSRLIAIVFAWRSRVFVAGLASMQIYERLAITAARIQRRRNFWRRWHRQWRVSSGEDNPYGHPSPELLERLEASGARVLRTDRDGAVHIETDGERLEISCFVACPELPMATTSKRAEAPNQD